jgi:hypothetical protein
MDFDGGTTDDSRSEFATYGQWYAANGFVYMLFLWVGPCRNGLGKHDGGCYRNDLVLGVTRRKFGREMRTPRGTLAVAVLSLVLAVCPPCSGGNQRTEHPPASMGHAIELSAGPSIARRVALAPVPESARRVCRAAQAATREPLLCARRLPRPVPSLERNRRFSRLQTEPLFPTPRVASEVSFSYGELPPHRSWRLRPCCHFHFTIDALPTAVTAAISRTRDHARGPKRITRPSDSKCLWPVSVPLPFPVSDGRRDISRHTSRTRQRL